MAENTGQELGSGGGCEGWEGRRSLQGSEEGVEFALLSSTPVLVKNELFFYTHPPRAPPHTRGLNFPSLFATGKFHLPGEQGIKIPKVPGQDRVTVLPYPEGLGLTERAVPKYIYRHTPIYTLIYLKAKLSYLEWLIFFWK